MEWNVCIYNCNKNKIELFNIFNHWNFSDYIKKHIKKYKTKDEFLEQVQRELRYYFWSKSEYELIIEITKNNRVCLIPWCGCKNPEEAKIDVTNETDFDWRAFAIEHIEKQIYDNKAKIDVFEQVMFKWDLFSEYVWNHRKELLKHNDV